MISNQNSSYRRVLAKPSFPLPAPPLLPPLLSSRPKTASTALSQSHCKKGKTCRWKTQTTPGTDSRAVDSTRIKTACQSKMAPLSMMVSASTPTCTADRFRRWVPAGADGLDRYRRALRPDAPDLGDRDEEEAVAAAAAAWSYASAISY